MDELKRTNIKLISILLILVGTLICIWPVQAFPPAEIVVPGGEFNLTATVSETYIYWTFDNATYNITIDDTVGPTEFTGEAYLLTNLRRNTRHMMVISNDTLTYVDYQTTLSTFWDTEYFLMLCFGIFFLLLGWKSPIFTLLAVVVFILDTGIAWTYYGADFLIPVYLTVFLGLGAIVRFIGQYT